MGIAAAASMKYGLPTSVRVFLTNPPLNMAETPLQYHRPLVPLGLGYLGAIIEDAATGGAWDEHVRAVAAGRRSAPYQPSGVVAGQDNMLLSFYGRFDFERLIRRMTAFLSEVPGEGQYIGLSVLSDGMRAARYMLKEFRRRFPHATLLVGGPHATFFPHDFYSDPEKRLDPLADFVVKNEGERAILGILRGECDSLADLARNARNNGVNLSGCDYSDPDYKVIDGGQFRSEERVVSSHVLDELPAPAYFLFEGTDRSLPYEPDRRYGLEAPAANINSSRGCPHRCTFCTIPKLVPGYRTLSPQRITELVAFLDRQYSVRSVFFREDNFMYSGGRLDGDRWPDVIEICAGLQSRAGRMRWAIEARADNLLADSGVPGVSRLSLLRRAGLTGVYMGVESGSERMLKLYAKESTLSDMKTAIRACHEEDVAVVATACYSDSDLLKRNLHAGVKISDSSYLAAIERDRRSILRATRELMMGEGVPNDRREEYALVGIPVSVTYEVLRGAMREYPDLVEHYDPVTRYLYPKGFKWWAAHVYKPSRRVRAFFGYGYEPEDSIRGLRVSA